MSKFSEKNAPKVLGAKELAREKKKRIAEYRKEANRKVSMANKRLRRLEQSGLTDSPAYQSVVKNGKPQFSTKGKGYNELQKEVARIDKFLNAKTSTIRGINTNLKQMANNTGIKYKNLTELRSKANKFFELASKVEQYLRNVKDAGSAFGSTRIFKEVNKYIEDVSRTINVSKLDIDEAILKISDALTEYDTEHEVTGLYNDEHEGWFKLDKN